MTPKDKAKELHQRMWDMFPAQSAIHFDLKPFVKDCALIAVDYLIKEEVMWKNGKVDPEYYWKEVKAEIEKL